MKKKLILIISFIVILGIIVGTTLAWIRWNSTNTNVTFNIEGATITYNGGADISNVMLIPVSSKEKDDINYKLLYICNLKYEVHNCCAIKFRI